MSTRREFLARTGGIVGAAALGRMALPELAGAAPIGVFGVTDPGYTAAFKRGSSQVQYPYSTVCLEHQTWATPFGQIPGHHSEHMHQMTAFPLGVTFTDAIPWDIIDVGYTFHNVADYKVIASSQSAVTQNGSRNVWSATQAQLNELQAAMDASSSGAVIKVYQSYPITRPTMNGIKELRGGIQVQADGPEAIFKTWRLDQRVYYTDNYAGLPASTPLINQQAVRLRSQVAFPKQGDPTIIQDDYHHSGWSGMDGQYGTLQGEQGSQTWNRTKIAKVWSDTADKKIGLYVTDGGGPATLMIDPDFHNHYDAPTAACPIVENGNCLGKWAWTPSNARKELYGLVNQEVVIPKAVIASLAPGIHKLVFLSTDNAECVRANNPCPPDARGSWSNVSVLPFKVV